jgi:hypothetical protein
MIGSAPRAATPPRSGHAGATDLAAAVFALPGEDPRETTNAEPRRHGWMNTPDYPIASMRCRDALAAGHDLRQRRKSGCRRATRVTDEQNNRSEAQERLEWSE